MRLFGKTAFKCSYRFYWHYFLSLVCYCHYEKLFYLDRVMYLEILKTSYLLCQPHWNVTYLFLSSGGFHFFMSFTVESPSVAVAVNVFLIPILLDFRILCICYISMPPVSCFGYLSLTNFLLLLQISNEKVMILFEKSIIFVDLFRIFSGKLRLSEYIFLWHGLKNFIVE